MSICGGFTNEDIASGAEEQQLLDAVKGMCESVGS